MNKLLIWLSEKLQTGLSHLFITFFIACSALPIPALANLVINGSFDDPASTTGFLASGTSNLQGWNIGMGSGNATYGYGYSFLAKPGSAGTNFADPTASQWVPISLWDSNTNGGLNPIPDTSPLGGNFIIADGAFRLTTLYQTVSGLEVGEDYKLSFYQAAGQERGFDGDTQEQWQVSWGGSLNTTNSITLPNGQIYTDPTEVISGGDVQLSEVMNNPSHGFQDWQKQTMTFTATATSQLLGFLALGSPLGQPPFVLLDGISLDKITEPNILLLILSGGFLLFISMRRKLS